MTPTSLQRHVLALSLAVTLVLWVAVASLSYLHTRREIGRVFDAYLVQTAAILAAQAGDEIDDLEFEQLPALITGGQKVAFQVWDSRGHLVAHAPRELRDRLSEATQGFRDEVVAGQRWRVYCYVARRGEFTIYVADRADAREMSSGHVGGKLLLPLVVAFPLLAAALWFTVRRGLRPLHVLADEVALRAPDQLAPLDTAGVPDEVLPLVERLNVLLARVEQAMLEERRFTADAAHELRTPIAGISAQAQVARNACDDASRSHALDGVITGCDRAARLIEQLLTLARVEAVPALSGERCDVAQCAAVVIADLAPAALAKAVALELLETSNGHARASLASIEILLRNLLDNAVRYSPPDTVVTLDVASGANTVDISVTDQGPGIPVEERANVLRRFHRLAPGGETGSGLGLSIVSRIVETHGGSLTLGDGPGGRGTRVEVSLPAA